MDTLKEQLEKQYGDKVQNLQVDTEYGFVDFQNDNGTWFWAKLTPKTNKIKKHSIRLAK